MNKRHILLSFCTLLALSVSAQKITLGSCRMKDGGEYKGQMMAGKPHGKGKTTWKDGDSFEGEYAKGKRQGYGVYTFHDGEKYDIEKNPYSL